MKTHPELFASFSTSGDTAIASALAEPVILAVMVAIGSRGLASRKPRSCPWPSSSRSCRHGTG